MARRSSSTRDTLAASFLCSLLASPLAAQCGVQWLPGAPAAGLGGYAHAAVTLANGDVVVGGSFPIVDGIFVDNIARHDGTAWHAIGNGLGGDVLAVATMPNGDVVAGGAFPQRIARWNGTSWAPFVGGGIAAGVNAIAVLPNGVVFASSPYPVSALHRWNGSTWTQVASAISPNGVQAAIQCLAALPNGDIVVGGAFTSIGGVATGPLAIWNGTTWSGVPGFTNSSIRDIEVLPSGGFAVAGGLVVSGVLADVAIVNGAAVQTLPALPGFFAALAAMGNGDLVAAGVADTPFNVPPTTGNVARWNGSAWTTFGPGAPASTMALAVTGGTALVAAGVGFGTGANTFDAVARHDGAGWTTLGGPRPPRIDAVVQLRNGDVVVAGEFTSIGGINAANVALRQSGAFVPLGLGVNGRVTAIGAGPDGSLIVSGDFTSAGGGPANRVARWNGSAWTTLGAGLGEAASSVAIAANGNAIAAAGPSVMYFDGATWNVVPGIQGPSVEAAVAAPQGGFVLAGFFPTQTGAVLVDGGAVTPTDLPLGVQARLATAPDGGVLAASYTSPQGTRIFRLQGSQWSLVGAPSAAFALAFTVLPNGDPTIATNGSGGAGAWQVRLARQALGTWSTLADGITTTNWSQNQAFAMHLAVSAAGEIVLGGDVLATQNGVTAGLAIATPACPAAVSAFGTACFGAAGPMSLDADNLPWLGGTFRSTASGFTATSLGVHAIGTQPLAVALPLGAPGCSLFLQPDVLDLLLPGNGTATATFAVPRAASLAGLQARTQVVGLELDGAGNLIRLTSTNALQLTIGGL